MATSTSSTLTLPDGASLGFDIIGAEHLKTKSPIVLVGGVSSLRGDWDRLSTALGRVRPVLVYDHRGMGGSKLANKDERQTIELLARDLLFLLEHLGWKELSLCGFSMGGVIVQQLILLPYHPERPTPLPFRVTHVFLTGSLCTPLRDPAYGLPAPPASGQQLSEQDKLDIARGMMELSFDPAWLSDPRHASRIEEMVGRMISGRPRSVILKQLRAMNRFDFTGMHTKLPRTMPFLVIHGELDRIVPPYCGQEILRQIPWAQSLELGHKPGMVPNAAFGHSWFEYFDAEVWVGVIERFIATSGSVNARL
ncbi:Alpha/Beta hydrolase protein [Mycena amicta]|nr:Alpha/Beta hydrolase protein [Mycena amicta]